MNRMSAPNTSGMGSPVSGSVPIPVPSVSETPTKPVKSVMVEGSALWPGKKKWKNPNGSSVPPGMGLGSVEPLAAHASLGIHRLDVRATPVAPAAVRMNARRDIGSCERSNRVRYQHAQRGLAAPEEDRARRNGDHR